MPHRTRNGTWNMQCCSCLVLALWPNPGISWFVVSIGQSGVGYREAADRILKFTRHACHYTLPPPTYYIHSPTPAPAFTVLHSRYDRQRVEAQLEIQVPTSPLDTTIVISPPNLSTFHIEFFLSCVNRDNIYSTLELFTVCDYFLLIEMFNRATSQIINLSKMIEIFNKSNNSMTH